MIPHVVFGAVLAATTASGVVAGLLSRWRRDAAVRKVLAETASTSARIEPLVRLEPQVEHPYRTPETRAVRPPTKSKLRDRSIRGHDYDRMVGRTFAR